MVLHRDAHCAAPLTQQCQRSFKHRQRRAALLQLHFARLQQLRRRVEHWKSTVVSLFVGALQPYYLVDSQRTDCDWPDCANASRPPVQRLHEPRLPFALHAMVSWSLADAHTKTQKQKKVYCSSQTACDGASTGSVDDHTLGPWAAVAKQALTPFGGASAAMTARGTKRHSSEPITCSHALSLGLANRSCSSTALLFFDIEKITTEKVAKGLDLSAKHSVDTKTAAVERAPPEASKPKKKVRRTRSSATR